MIASGSAVEIALDYHRRGWCPIPIPFGKKAPVIPGWQDLRLTPSEIEQRFSSQSNIGVINGEASNWLGDVDLDHPDAVRLAPEYLPLTVTFGREGNPKSHYLYQLSAPASTKQHTTSKGMAVELRVNGQTIFPGSTHPSGELVEWTADGEPAIVDPKYLHRCVEQLAAAVKAIHDPQPTSEPTRETTKPARQEATDDETLERARRYVAKMRPAISEQGGHNQTYKVACKLVLVFDLSPSDAMTVLRQYNKRCEPPWTEQELQHKIDDATKSPVGGGFSSDDNPIANGKYFPNSEGKDKLMAVSLADVASEIRERADGAPFVANGCLFVHRGDEIHWLERTEDVFGWLADHGGANWYAGPSFPTKPELRAFVKRTSKQFEAIERYPHEPRIDGHYYMCGESAEGDGSHLQQLLDMFSPETTIDRDLLQAFAMTIAWGGPGGSRPGFILTADGRGFGKTTTVEKIASIFGGCVSFSITDKAKDLKERLLSTDALARRVAFLDNIKTNKLSSGDLEALLTASEISGKRMYHGDATRPNTITWAFTLNGVALSKDMSERCVIIRMKKPTFSGDWAANISAFINDNRQHLIADIIAALRGERFKLDKYSRWGLWEREVLERLPEPNEAQRVIQERAAAVDSDLEEADIIADGFRGNLARLGYSVDVEQVFIPSKIAADWFSQITGDKIRTVAACRTVNQMIQEGQLPFMKKNTHNGWGRGFVWSPEEADIDTAIATDIEERMGRMGHMGQ